MSAPRTTIAAALALALAPQPGCSGVCRGPGCEDSWPASRLSIVRGAIAGPTLDVWEDADARLDGSEIEGARWSVDAAPGVLLLGQPEDDRVVRLAAPADGVRPVRPEASWTGPGSGLGAAVVTQPAPDGSGGFDLWAGAPEHRFGRGAVALFRDAHLDPGRTIDEADLLLVGASPNDGLGTRIFPCADLTGDRVPELVVTAPWFARPEGWAVESTDGIPALAGAIFLIQSGSVANKSGTWAPWEVGRVWWGASVGEGAGSAVVCDRDLDGDGLVDLAVGAPWAEGNRGRVYLLSGDPLPPSGRLDRVAWATLRGREESEWYGTALATLALGTEPRLVVGASGWQSGAGRVHVYAGAGLAAEEPRRIAAFEPEAGRALPDHLGRWLATGDVDGDRVEDLLIGAPDYKVGRNAYDAGRLWIWSGARASEWRLGTPSDLADVVIAGDQPFQRVGGSGRVFDLDGDGLQDLLLPTRAPAPR